jgi:hypothetical protein
MNEFMADRTRLTYTHDAPARPAEVFPLLCPTREYDWIPDWQCDLVYSESGFAENNCVFRTDISGFGPETWVVSRYEPPLAIEFTRFHPDRITKLDIQLSANNDGKTRLTWTHTFTGLTEAGNLFAGHVTAEAFEGRMAGVAGLLNYYLEHGRMADLSGH